MAAQTVPPGRFTSCSIVIWALSVTQYTQLCVLIWPFSLKVASSDHHIWSRKDSSCRKRVRKPSAYWRRLSASPSQDLYGRNLFFLSKFTTLFWYITYFWDSLLVDFWGLRWRLTSSWSCYSSEVAEMDLPERCASATEPVNSNLLTIDLMLRPCAGGMLNSLLSHLLASATFSLDK